MTKISTSGLKNLLASMGERQREKHCNLLLGMRYLEVSVLIRYMEDKGIESFGNEDITAFMTDKLGFDPLI